MSVIASRYIQALWELPKSEKEVEVVERGLKDIKELFLSNDEFKKVMVDPRIENSIKTDIIKEIFKEYEETCFINYINLLIEEGRINYITEIADEYEKINKALKKELSLKIVVAKPIDDDQVEAIIEKFKQKYNVEKIYYEVQIDESILGGVKVIVGNKIYDGSILTQLEKML